MRFCESEIISYVSAVSLNIPSRLPVMILPNVTLFPGMMLPLFIFEPRYRRMLADVLEGDRMFALAMHKPGSQREIPVSIGGVGLVRVSVQNDDGTSNLVLQGLARVTIERRVQYKPYPIIAVAPIDASDERSVTAEALMAKLKDIVSARFVLSSPIDVGGAVLPEGMTPAKLTALIMKQFKAIESPGQLADLVSSSFIRDSALRQEILETVAVEERLRKLIHFLLEGDG